MRLQIGSAVAWTSSNTEKTGIVLAVVPAGRLPADVGHPAVGKGSLSRGEESYVVRGAPKGGRQALYWPLVSLLEPASGLTAEEIRWCQGNVEAVRALIAKSKAA